MSSASLLPCFLLLTSSQPVVPRCIHLNTVSHFFCWLTLSSPYPFSPPLHHQVPPLPPSIINPERHKVRTRWASVIAVFLVDKVSQRCHSVPRTMFGIWGRTSSTAVATCKPPVALWVRAEPDHHSRFVTEGETLLLASSFRLSLGFPRSSPPLCLLNPPFVLTFLSFTLWNAAIPFPPPAHLVTTVTQSLSSWRNWPRCHGIGVRFRNLASTLRGNKKQQSSSSRPVFHSSAMKLIFFYIYIFHCCHNCKCEVY